MDKCARAINFHRRCELHCVCAKQGQKDFNSGVAWHLNHWITASTEKQQPQKAAAAAWCRRFIYSSSSQWGALVQINSNDATTAANKLTRLHLTLANSFCRDLLPEHTRECCFRLWGVMAKRRLESFQLPSRRGRLKRLSLTSGCHILLGMRENFAGWPSQKF